MYLPGKKEVQLIEKMLRRKKIKVDIDRINKQIGENLIDKDNIG